MRIVRNLGYVLLVAGTLLRWLVPGYTVAGTFTMAAGGLLIALALLVGVRAE